MKKKLPKVVYPLGVPFRVEEIHMDKSDYGETEGHERLIRVNTDPKKKKSKEQTLFHEYMHAVLHVAGLSCILDDDHEEALVSCLEIGLWPLVVPERMGRKK